MIPLLSWMLDVTVKGSLLVLLVAAIMKLVGPRLDPRWRHLLWLVVLLRLLLPAAPAASWSPFNLVMPLEVPAPMRAVAAAPEQVAQKSPDVAFTRTYVVQPSPWFTAARWFFYIWVAGAALLLLRALLASLRTQRAVSRALRRAEANGSLQAVVEEGRGMLGIRRSVRIVESDLVRTPALHGLLRPVILLPSGLVSSFTAGELRNVVLHELWHQRRSDVAMSWLLSAAQAIHWFNPVVWFAASRIREERELACDELSLSCLEEEERIGYGMTILKLLERFRAPAPIPALSMGMVGIVNEREKMKRRMTMIASFRNRTRFSTLLMLTVLAVTAVGLTDAASGGEAHKRIMKELDPATLANVERLDQKVSFELNNASFSELLTAISNQTGLVVTQAPELSTSSIQSARFTLKAEQVPAHVALMESLLPFQLMAHPDAHGVKIVDGAGEVEVFHGPGVFEKKIMVTEGTPDGIPRTIDVTGDAPDGEMKVRVQRTDGLPGDGEKIIMRKHAAGEAVLPGDGQKVMVRRQHAPGEAAPGELADKMVWLEKNAHDAGPDADGHIRRDLTMKFSVDGVETEGKLTLDIATK